MTYINPISILNIPQGSPLSVNDTGFLKQEKKRLLADFELADGPTISLAGQELDRATVLKLFEQLEDSRTQAAHVKVYQFSSLNLFLERGDITLFSQGEIQKLKELEDDFLAWLSPYFAKAFNPVLLKAFQAKDWETLRLLCQDDLPISPAYQAASYKDTYRLIHQYIEELAQLTDSLKLGTKPGPQVQEFTDELLIDSLNQLPAYFDTAREKYASGLEDLCVVLYNEQKRFTLAAFVLKQAIKVQSDSDTQQRLSDLLTQMDQQPTPIFDFSGGVGEQKRSPIVWAGVGTLAIIILLLLL